MAFFLSFLDLYNKTLWLLWPVFLNLLYTYREATHLHNLRDPFFLTFYQIEYKVDYFAAAIGAFSGFKDASGAKFS